MRRFSEEGTWSSGKRDTSKGTQHVLLGGCREERRSDAATPWIPQVGTALWPLLPKQEHTTHKSSLWDQPSNRWQQCSLATSVQRGGNGQHREDCTLQMCTFRSNIETESRGMRRWVWHSFLYLKHLQTNLWASTLNWPLIITLPEFHWVLKTLSLNWRWFNHYWMIEFNCLSYVSFPYVEWVWRVCQKTVKPASCSFFLNWDYSTKLVAQRKE